MVCNLFTFKSLILLIYGLLLAVCQDSFYYFRTLNCVQNNSVKCVQWQEGTYLSYYPSWTGYCFSENAHVLTSEGPRPMKDLKVGDQVLGIDPQTGTKAYSKIQAWLHRDEDAIVQYEIIATNEGSNFESSDFHNIGVVNDAGKIDFKFAKDLVEGDKLVGFPVQNLKVSSASSHEQRQGLFAPFTENGNYFVFHSDFQSSNGTEQPMILAHALSQVSDPTSQMATAQRFISLWGTLGLNSQPSEHQHYINPLISTFNFVFGSHWQKSLQQVKYTRSSVSHDSSELMNHKYYNSGYNAQRQRQDRMKAVGLSISITQQTFLF